MGMFALDGAGRFINCTELSPPQALAHKCDSPLIFSTSDLSLPPAHLVCPVGHEPRDTDRGRGCVECAVGTYSLAAESACAPCPPGARCDGGSMLAAAPGFWQSDLEQDAFFRCSASACCEADADESCARDDPRRCGPWRRGVLCGRCLQGRTLWAGECVHCGGTKWGWLGLSLLFYIGLVAYSVSRPKGLSAMYKIVVDYFGLMGLAYM